MASPLFRTHDPNLAGWKTGSNKIVGLKMAVQNDKDLQKGELVDENPGADSENEESQLIHYTVKTESYILFN